MHQDLCTGEVIQCEEPDAPKAGDLKFVQQKATSDKGELFVKMPKNLCFIWPKKFSETLETLNNTR